MNSRNINPRSTRRNVVAGLLGCVAGAALATPHSARAAWPSRTVRIVVPFPPGGGADLVSRLLAPPLQQNFAESFFVENRSGAAGRIGTGIVAKAEPDGQTLLVTTESSIVIAPHTGVVMDYDPLKELAPVSLLTRNTIILVVHPSVPANTVQEFIALARAKPGQILFGSSGLGGPNHLAGEMFKRITGVDIVHVPFPGTGAALQGVMSNQVSAMWGFTAGLVPQIRAGALKAIAIGGRERSPALPEVPTFAESGVADYVAASWIGMFAPHGTEAAIIDRLNGAVKNAMREENVKELLMQNGSEIVASTSAELSRVIASDDAKYAKLADLFQNQK
jgi:tripartite-type tricarboxylate transporter receptor subunit TctC